MSPETTVLRWMRLWLHSGMRGRVRSRSGRERRVAGWASASARTWSSPARALRRSRVAAWRISRAPTPRAFGSARTAACIFRRRVRRSDRACIRLSRRSRQRAWEWSRKTSLSIGASAILVDGQRSSITLAQLAASDLADNGGHALDVSVTYDAVQASHPYATHVCLVEVDAETGA